MMSNNDQNAHMAIARASDSTASQGKTTSKGGASMPSIGPSPYAERSVAQSAAMVVQDGQNYVKQVQTLATTAIAFCVEKIVVEKDLSYVPILQQMEQLVPQAGEAFSGLGTAAGTVLKAFTGTDNGS